MKSRRIQKRSPPMIANSKGQKYQGMYVVGVLHFLSANKANCFETVLFPSLVDTLT